MPAFRLVALVTLASSKFVAEDQVVRASVLALLARLDVLAPRRGWLFLRALSPASSKAVDQRL